MKKSFILIITASVFLFMALACSSQDTPPAKPSSPKRNTAPSFTLSGLKGNMVSLGGFSGEKGVLLDFTTTWCPACVTIIPAVKNIYRNYDNNGLKVLAVYINEPKERVEAFVKKHNIPYTVLLDTDGAIANKYSIRGVPTVVVVDKQGLVRYKGHGIPEEIIEQVAGE